jgi:hypothetical protein
MAALAVAGVGDASLVAAGFAGPFPNATLLPVIGCPKRVPNQLDWS